MIEVPLKRWWYHQSGLTIEFLAISSPKLATLMIFGHLRQKFITSCKGKGQQFKWQKKLFFGGNSVCQCRFQDNSVQILRSSNGPYVQELWSWTIWTTKDHVNHADHIHHLVWWSKKRMITTKDLLYQVFTTNSKYEIYLKWQIISKGLKILGKATMTNCPMSAEQRTRCSSSSRQVG